MFKFGDAGAYLRVTLLEELVDGDESLEGLNLILKDRLHTQAGPDGRRRVIIPRVNDKLCSGSI